MRAEVYCLCCTTVYCVGNMSTGHKKPGKTEKEMERQCKEDLHQTGSNIQQACSGMCQRQERVGRDLSM